MDLNTHLHPEEGTVGPPGRGTMLVNGGRIDPSPALSTLNCVHTLRTCRTSLLPALTTASMFLQILICSTDTFSDVIPFPDLEVLQYLSFIDSPEL